jgi:hypothetical protein
MTDAVPTSAYIEEATGRYHATGLTRGPWHPDHQHAGPPIALVCRAVENAAREQGLTHRSRITASLLRPLPIGEMAIEVATDYTGRNAGHYSARLIAAGKEVALFTALMQRQTAVTLPDTLPGHPLPALLPAPEECPVATFPFASSRLGYADLVEARLARGHFFRGPCATWFRLRHPLLEGALPGSYERVAVAADSGNGISAVLDLSKYVFVNSDLTINLLRRPQGEWIGLDARTQLGPDGGGLAESALFDGRGLIGRATQSLSVRRRE